jgi:hypothetical protein
MDFFRLETMMGSNKSKKKSHKSATTRKQHRKRLHKKSIKSMNCSPMVEGQTVSEDTCYTSAALTKIKEAYNKNNTSNKIAATDPNQVFEELKSKLSQCKKEDCWLKQLPEAEQKYLDEHLFAPDQPDEWSKNSNEWLSNVDIFKVLHQYETKYKNFKLFGPTPIDFDTRVPEENKKCVWEELCTFSLEEQIQRKIDKIGVVFNLDKHDESGSHWTSMFIDIKERVIFYFDSAANDTPPEVLALVKKIRNQGKPLHMKFRYYDNLKHRHQSGNTECGMYSLFFIITMLTNKTEFDTNMSMSKKLNLFRRKKIPDKYVEKYRNVYFNN